MPAGKVTITLPEGMDEAEFSKLFGTFQKQRVEGQFKGKATAKAIQRLKAAHEDEYEGYYQDEYARAKKAGVK